MPNFTTREYVRKFDSILISIILVCEVFQKSGLFQAFIPKGNALLFTVEMALILYFCIIEMVRGNVAPSFLAIIFFSYMAFQCKMYEYATFQPANYNAIFSYLGFLLFIPFVLTQQPFRKILWTLFYLCLAYAAVYVFFNNYLLSLLSSNPDANLVLRSSERSDRLFMANSLVSFGIIFIICNFRKNIVLSIISIPIFCYAIYLSDSRVFLVITSFSILVALLAMAFPFTRPVVAYSAALAFVAICIYSVSGLFTYSINPYEYIFSDSSGAARYLEFRAARAHFDEGRLLTGMGIAPSSEDLQRFVQSLAPFYPADLGASGIFFTFGIIGLLFFLFLSVTMIISIKRRDARSPELLGLYFSGFSAAIIGFFAATIFGASGVMICALVFAAIVRSGQHPLLERLLTGRRTAKASQPRRATTRS